MAIARALSKSWTYVLPEDRSLPPEQQTRFHLKPLSVEQRASLLDGLRAGEEGQLFDERLGSRLLRSLRAGLVGWENFPDGEGGFVPFEAKGGVVTEACLERLETHHITQLARAIENETKMDAPAVEKPEPPST